MFLKTKELVKQTGVSPETLRYYEKQHLLEAPPRTEGGYRCYPKTAVDEIRFIKQAQKLGFTLGEIRRLIKLKNHSGTSCEEVKKLAEEKIQEIQCKIELLQKMKTLLTPLVEACKGTDDEIEHCPILKNMKQSNL